MRQKPLVSVIITNYNYADYVGQAIDSVLSQTYKNIELIVIDDGSSDSSDDVIRRRVAKSGDIQYIKQKNLGANISRNKGIDTAKGEFIFLLDADNWIESNHIEKLYTKLKSSDADVVYSNLKHFGDDDELFRAPEFDLDTLKATNFIDTSALIKKTSIGDNRFDLFLNRKSSQDWDFFLGLALKGLRVVKAPEGVQLNYRVHERQHGNSFKTISKIDKSIGVYKYITKKYAKLFPEEYSEQIKWTNNLVVDYAGLKKHCLQQSLNLGKRIEELDVEIQTVKESKTYRIGKVVTYPYRILRRLIGKKL